MKRVICCIIAIYVLFSFALSESEIESQNIYESDYAPVFLNSGHCVLMKDLNLEIWISDRQYVYKEIEIPKENHDNTVHVFGSDDDTCARIYVDRIETELDFSAYLDEHKKLAIESKRGTPTPIILNGIPSVFYSYDNEQGDTVMACDYYVEDHLVVKVYYTRAEGSMWSLAEFSLYSLRFPQ